MICSTVITAPCEPTVVVSNAGPPGPAGADGSPGDVGSATNVSADNEIVLFSGTGGKTIKRSSVLLSALATVAALNGKVDKIPDRGLSENDFTDAYKAILDGYIPGTFRGYFVNGTALTAAFPTAPNGSYAITRDVGITASIWIWDELNTIWVEIPKAPNTAATIQAVLATDSDYNKLTDARLNKLNDAVDTSTFTAAIEAFSGGTAFAAVITEPTTTRSLVGSDMGKYIRMDNPAGCDITVPNNATVPLPGFPEVRFRRTTSAGPITLTLGGGVTVNNASAISGVLAEGNFALKKVAVDKWDLVLNF